MEIFGMVLRNLFLSSRCLGVGAPHARTLSATKARGFFHWARCARKLTQSRLCPLQCKAGFVPRASGSAVRGVRGVRGVRQIVCVTGVWHFSLRLWPKKK